MIFENILNFWEVNSTRTWPRSYVFSFRMENQGSRSYNWKTIWKRCDFWKVIPARIDLAPTYLQSEWRIRDHVVLNGKLREILYIVKSTYQANLRLHMISKVMKKMIIKW